MGELEVGRVILGKYEITRVLGEGGMGVVFAARHRGLGNLVALKFLQRELRDDAESRARFAREARTLARIQSDHVARVIDVGAVDGTPFLVMEYLTGQDLARVLRQRGPLPVAEAIDLVLQACEAVADAHNLGIVHRDLKPANLFVTTGGDGAPFVKVLDFGIARSTRATDLPVTASTAVVGSPPYMAPEQLVPGMAADPRSDVWALGVILYEMLTGRRPFPGESLLAVSTAIARGTYPRASEHRPEIPAALDQAIAEALEPDPEARPSVAGFAARIAPSGADVARARYERIARFAARSAPVASEAPEHTVADGPPSSVLQSDIEVLAGVTGTGLVQSLAPRRHLAARWRRGAVMVGTMAAALFAGAALWMRWGPPSTAGANVTGRTESNLAQPAGARRIPSGSGAQPPAASAVPSVGFAGPSSAPSVSAADSLIDASAAQLTSRRLHARPASSAVPAASRSPDSLFETPQ